MTGMPSQRRRCSRTTPRCRAARSTTSTTTSILAKWKLAVVLEQGFQRARRRREAAGVRPDRARPHAGRGRARRDDRLPVVTEHRRELVSERRGRGPRRCASTGPRRATRSTPALIARASGRRSSTPRPTPRSGPSCSPAPATGRSARAWTCGRSPSGDVPSADESAAIAAPYMPAARGSRSTMPVVGAANGTARRRRASSCCSAATSSVASADAKFGLPEVKRGPVPRRRRHVHSARRIPLGVALELTLTGDSIDAARAVRARAGQRASCRPTRCSPTALAVAERIAANGPLGARRDQGARPARRRPTRRAPRSASTSGSAVVFASEDAKEGAHGVRREARAACGRVADVRAAVCRVVRPARGRARSRTSRRRRSAPGQVRVGVSRRGGQLPRRAARRQRVPDLGADRRSSPAASSPASSTRSATASPTSVVGDRVFGTGDRRARSPRRRSSPPARSAASPTASTTGSPRRSAWRTAPRTTCCARSRRVQPGEELIVLGAGGGVGLAAVQLGVRARGVGDGGRVVGREARRRRVVRRRAPHRPPVGRPPPGARATRSPTAPTSSSTRSVATSPSRRCASLRWGGRFVTVGYASGEIPRIPLNLVLLKGVHDPRLRVPRLRHAPRPTSCAATRRELLELLAARRVVPHIGAAFALDEAAAALRYVADGRAIGKVVIDVAQPVGELRPGRRPQCRRARRCRPGR